MKNKSPLKGGSVTRQMDRSEKLWNQKIIVASLSSP